MTDRIDQEGRAAFVSTLPRKVTELRATLGTLVADPRSARMRDELRRRFNALYSLTRSYGLPQLSDGLREGIAHLDAIRGAAQLSSRDLDTLAETIASLSTLAKRDLPDQPELFSRRGATASSPASPQNTQASADPVAEGPPHRETLVAQPAVREPGAPASVAPRTQTITVFPSVRPPDPEAASAAAVPSRTRTELQFPAVNAGSTPASTAAPPAAAPSALSSSPPASSPPLGLLVVGPESLARQVSTVVSREADVHAVSSFAEAVTAARDTAPDVILAACAAPADGLALLAALRGDPLTDFLPVVLLAEPHDGVDAERARENGAADYLVQPTNEALRACIDRCARALLPPASPPPALREVTLEELTRTLAEELRRGLLDAAGPRGNRTKMQLGGGSEVLAATWAAIARVREIVEKRTQGRVRFELPAAPLGTGGAHVLALGDDATDNERATARDVEAGDDPLPERRALVVDDDPAVVRFFAGLLREAGMEVIECGDGSTAFEVARRVRPDVIVSDILMPGLDGFALCGAIRRDVALRHTPIVLLSWKDDLLLWMREMGAQAQGYLRKEARAEAILARVRSVLRPRVRLLRRLEGLSDDRELRGRVERVGAFALLETVGRALLDANLTLVDAHSTTELSVRGGTVVRAVRTAADGARVEGETALVRVLGVSNARFTVQRDARGVQRTVEGELAALLQRGAEQITALEAAVSAAALLEVSTVELDVAAATAYAQGLPASMRALVERVAAGEGPRSLLLRDKVAPDELEPLLIELVRAGVVRGLRGPAGQDLVAMRAAAQRESPRQASEPAREASSAGAGEWSLAAAPHAPHVEAAFAAHEKEEARGPEWSPPTNADEALRPGFGVENEADSLASAVLRELRAPRDDEAAKPTRSARPDPRKPSAPPAAVSHEPAVDKPAVDTPADETPAAESASTPEPARVEPEVAEEATKRLAPVVVAAEPAASAVQLDARGLPRTRMVTAPPPAGEAASAIVASTHRVGTTSDTIIVDEEAVGAPVSVHEPGADDAPGARGHASQSMRRAAAPGPSNGALFVGVLALGALSFFGVRAYLQYSEPQPAARPTATAAVSRAPALPEVTARPTARAPEPSATASAIPSASASVEPTASAPIEPAGPASATVTTGEPTEAELRDLVPGRALLTVNGVADELEYDHRPLGPAPRSVQLGPANSVGLTYRRGATTGFVLVTLEAGRATRVELPPP